MFDGGLAAASGVEDVTATVLTDPPTWQQVDRELRTLAKDRGALDAREAPLLRLLVRMEVWKYVSKVSLYSYVEDVLGYGPKVARDRVRVAFALEKLPNVAAALASGEHSYTAIRELTRVVVPETELEWLDTVRDCNSARVQELVSLHRRGDLPTDPPDFEAKLCHLAFEVAPSIVARLRDYRRELGDELGTDVDDTILFEALLASARSGGNRTSAPTQVQLTICEHCEQGFVEAGGRRVPVDDDERDLLECDAVRIGSDRQPSRATKDITPATRRAVWHRDHDRCVVPGCRSTRHVDIHHVISRAAGGGHGPDNLVLLCAGHHRLYHAGKITLDPPTAKPSQPHAGSAPKIRSRRSLDVTAGQAPSAGGQRRGEPQVELRDSRNIAVGSAPSTGGQLPREPQAQSRDVRDIALGSAPSAGGQLPREPQAQSRDSRGIVVGSAPSTGDQVQGEPQVQPRDSRDMVLGSAKTDTSQPRGGLVLRGPSLSSHDIALGEAPSTGGQLPREPQVPPATRDIALGPARIDSSQPGAVLVPRGPSLSSHDIAVDPRPSTASQRWRTPRVQSGGSQDSVVERAKSDTSHPGTARPVASALRESQERVAMKTDAIQALVQLGFTRAEARSMVEQASSTAALNVELPQLIVAALRFATILKSSRVPPA